MGRHDGARAGSASKIRWEPCLLPFLLQRPPMGLKGHGKSFRGSYGKTSCFLSRTESIHLHPSEEQQ